MTVAVLCQLPTILLQIALEDEKTLKLSVGMSTLIDFQGIFVILKLCYDGVRAFFITRIVRTLHFLNFDTLIAHFRRDHPESVCSFRLKLQRRRSGELSFQENLHSRKLRHHIQLLSEFLEWAR